MTATKRDWKKIVETSGGKLQFAPEKILEIAKPWHEKRLAFNKVVEELAKMEADLGHDFNDMIFKMRQFYDEAGRKDIWTKDVGFEEGAINEGEFIVAITDSVKG